MQKLNVLLRKGMRRVNWRCIKLRGTHSRHCGPWGHCRCHEGCCAAVRRGNSLLAATHLPTKQAAQQATKRAKESTANSAAQQSTGRDKPAAVVIAATEPARTAKSVANVGQQAATLKALSGLTATTAVEHVTHALTERDALVIILVVTKPLAWCVFYSHLPPQYPLVRKITERRTFG